MRARRAAFLAICWAAVSACGAAHAGDVDNRRLEIARMSPADQQELLRKQERFLALSVTEQDRLRALQADIDADPDAARLRQVLTGYHEWLKTLSPSERAGLAEMPPADRVKEIKSIVRKQEGARQLAQSQELLTSRDKREIVTWLGDIVWQHRDRLIEKMPPDRRKGFSKDSEEEQRRALVFMAFQRARREGGAGGLLDIDEKSIERLAGKLSDKAQGELSKQPSLAEKRKTVGGWIATAMFERSSHGRGSRRSSPPPEADVARFFQQELQPRERDELMNLPPSEARERLRRMYWQRERGESMLRGGPGGPRPDDWHRGGRPPDGDSIGPRKGPPRPPGDRPPPPPKSPDDEDPDEPTL